MTEEHPPPSGDGESTTPPQAPADADATTFIPHLAMPSEPAADETRVHPALQAGAAPPAPPQQLQPESTPPQYTPQPAQHYAPPQQQHYGPAPQQQQYYAAPQQQQYYAPPQPPQQYYAAPPQQQQYYAPAPQQPPAPPQQVSPPDPGAPARQQRPGWGWKSDAQLFWLTGSFLGPNALADARLANLRGGITQLRMDFGLGPLDKPGGDHPPVDRSRAGAVATVLDRHAQITGRDAWQNFQWLNGDGALEPLAGLYYQTLQSYQRMRTKGASKFRVAGYRDVQAGAATMHASTSGPGVAACHIAIQRVTTDLRSTPEDVLTYIDSWYNWRCPLPAEQEPTQAKHINLVNRLTDGYFSYQDGWAQAPFDNLPGPLMRGNVIQGVALLRAGYPAYAGAFGAGQDGNAAAVRAILHESNAVNSNLLAWHQLAYTPSCVHDALASLDGLLMACPPAQRHDQLTPLLAAVILVAQQLGH